MKVDEARGGPGTAAMTPGLPHRYQHRLAAVARLLLGDQLVHLAEERQATSRAGGGSRNNDHRVTSMCINNGWSVVFVIRELAWNCEAAYSGDNGGDVGYASVTRNKAVAGG